MSQQDSRELTIIYFIFYKKTMKKLVLAAMSFSWGDVYVIRHSRTQDSILCLYKNALRENRNKNESSHISQQQNTQNNTTANHTINV